MACCACRYAMAPLRGVRATFRVALVKQREDGRKGRCAYFASHPGKVFRTVGLTLHGEHDFFRSGSGNGCSQRWVRTVNFIQA